MDHLPAAWAFQSSEAQEVAPRTFFVSVFSGVIAFETDEGLVLVDTGVQMLAPIIHAAIRAKTKAPLHTVIYTHGHIDHAFGLGPWLAESQGTKPRVVAHRAVRDRFARYEKMRGLNEHINRVQFKVEGLEWPRPEGEIDLVYEDSLQLVVGGETFELHHARGETDDATWVYAPGRKILCPGDFWIGCAPNAGNPQKVQRYAEEWRDALLHMASMNADLALPGHGAPLVGADNIRTMLTDAAEYLRIVVEQTLAGLNAGKRHEEIVASVKIPEELASKPYLLPAYDRPEFIARNVIRLHAGWWDGFAANLLPAAPEVRAKEIATLAGGVGALVARARTLAESDLPLACHLAEWALLAAPDEVTVRELVRDVFLARAKGEPSLMARSIFERAAANADPSKPRA
jgi:glyoxylase-like metal-dependent hydrolase (beta-lactamase superfamily II)